MVSRSATRRSLISVVLPAFNAERTIAQTLESVALQTHRELEILIIDDGSTDRTAAIAAEFCAWDKRAHLLRQVRGGVAKARNRGIDEANGAWIAPIDADDLWHPEKIERQLRVFGRSSDEVALVYNWFRKIDENGRVIEPPFSPMVAGRVLLQHLQWNFIGNGSTPLIRREALDGLRYNPELQAAGNQGCEDFLLQLQIAARFEFACAPAFLTGYRTASATMSADVARMIRSHIQMYRILHAELDGAARREVERQLARWRAVHGLVLLRRREIRAGCSELLAAVRKSPGAAVRECWSSFRRPKGRAWSQEQLADPLIGQTFLGLSPEEGVPREARPADLARSR